MAITVKSVNQILSSMIKKLLAETDVTDVSEGSVVGTLLEGAALADFQNQVSLLKVLESSNLESLVGTDLDNKAIDMSIPDGAGSSGRIAARRATGLVKISSGFTKKSSSIYLGKPAPFAGSLRLYVQNASGWPSSGQVYLGRGTLNEEGPVTYTAVQNRGTFYELTLSTATPLVKNHSFSELIVLAQGGVREIQSGLTIIAPANAGDVPVQYTTDTTVSILDGESEVLVPVKCTVFGETGNVSAGAIKVFGSVPFTGATVTNELAFSNGASAENDESLRERIKNHPATLARGTKTAIAASLRGLRDPVSGKTITSLNIVEPTELGDPARCYIDDGSGFEPTLLGQDYETLLPSASGQEVLFKTANSPITACTVIGTRTGPFQLIDGQTITVYLDGVPETFKVNTVDFVNLSSISVEDLVRAFNAQATNIAFRTALNRQVLSVFDLTGKAETMQVQSGELQQLLGLSTVEIRPLYLYKANKILSFKGKTASVLTADFPWADLSISDVTGITVVVDGVEQTFSITTTDLAKLGTSFSDATIDQWAQIIRTKVAGVRVSVLGSKLEWASWQEKLATGTIEVRLTKADGSSANWIGANKMWDPNAALSAAGSIADYEVNRLSGQIKLLKKPSVSDSITLGSLLTRAEVQSQKAATGAFSLGVTSTGNGKLIVGIDGSFSLRSVPVSGSASLAPTLISANSNLVRLYCTDTTVFSGLEVGDFLYLVRDTALAKPFPSRAQTFYKIKQKGLQTWGQDKAFSACQFTVSAGSNVVSVTTSTPHQLVVGQIVQISNSALASGNVGVVTSNINGSRVVTEVIGANGYKFLASAAPTTVSTPNTLDVLIEQDSYVDVETSQTQRLALFGQFTGAQCAVTVGSNQVTVTLYQHDYTTGSVFTVTSASTDLATAFGGSGFITGNRTVVSATATTFTFAASTVALSGTGTLTIDGQEAAAAYPFDLNFKALKGFRCVGTIPQIIDLGSATTQTADSLAALISSQLVGGACYKLSPRQIALRTHNFDAKTSSVAIFAIIGAAENVFSVSVANGIQPHIAAKSSQYVGSGFAYVQGIGLPTVPSSYYPTHGYLKIGTTTTEVLEQSTAPAIRAHSGVTTYPSGLQEIGISGRNSGLLSRVYNNNTVAPFSGFVTGGALPQTVNGTNTDKTSLSLRMHDLPLSFTDKFIVEMDLDAVNKTTSVPMAKLAQIESMSAIAGGSPGSQIEFTLKDPEDPYDNDANSVTADVARPFFQANSPFRAFDFTDFNVLFQPTAIHTVYPNIASPFSSWSLGNPNQALVFKSTQFGSSHHARLAFTYPVKADVGVLRISHSSFEENNQTVMIANITLKSGAAIVGSEWTSLYNLTPSDYTSPTGAQIVKYTISALSINISGVFQVGNLLNISSGPFAGSHLIIQTPDANTVVVAAPGVRSTSYTPSLNIDGTSAIITSFPLVATTVGEVLAKASTYFKDSPVFVLEKTQTTVDATVVRYASYYTHGSTVAITSLTTLAQSLDYHAARAPFGCLASIHTYDPTNSLIRAVVQSSDAVLPVTSQLQGTGFSYVGQACYLVPANARAVERLLKFTAISPLAIQADISGLTNQGALQLGSLTSGSRGAVRVTGAGANEKILNALASAFKTGGSVKVKTDFVPAQAFPRGTLVQIQNAVPAPILRAYRTAPSAVATDSVVTDSNGLDVTTYFRRSTVVDYTRPSPNVGKFVFRKSISGIDGGETLEITKITPTIARIRITSGTGTLRARTGDMLVLRGSYTGQVNGLNMAYTSVFNSANQCLQLDSDSVGPYIGYPVVHVASTTEVYVIAPNITAETVTLRVVVFDTTSAVYQSSGLTRYSGLGSTTDISIGDKIAVTGFLANSNNGTFVVSAKGTGYVDVQTTRTSLTENETSVSGATVERVNTEVMFVPAINNEKNIQTNYLAGAPKLSSVWKVSSNEQMYYRVKTIGNGFAYVDFSSTSHQDLKLEALSVSTDDYVQFSDAFAQSNRGKFRIVAHNGVNALIIKNDKAVDEIVAPSASIIDGHYGTSTWQVGPIGDANLTNTDKRHVRIWDADSVFEGDKLVIGSPSTGSTVWFNNSLIGSWTIAETGLTPDCDVYVLASIPGASSTSQTIALAQSVGSVSFLEGTPYKGHKWAAGYAYNQTDGAFADMYLMPQVQDYKISPAYTTKFKALHKLGFDAETVIGVDAYKYFTQLISEAHKVIDGSSANTLAYPGVRASGTAVEVLAPLIKSIKLSFVIESKEGVSLNSIKSPVRSIITAYINNLGVGKEVILSEVTKRVQQVPGVKSVLVTSTSPVADDGVIKVGSFEVARIFKPEDIFI